MRREDAGGRRGTGGGTPNFEGREPVAQIDECETVFRQIGLDAFEQVRYGVLAE